MQKLILTFFFLSNIFLLCGQTEEEGDLCLKIFDKNGNVSGKTTIKLITSMGETLIADSNNCFCNLLLNRTYALHISSPKHFDYHKLISLTPDFIMDTVVLTSLIASHNFTIVSKSCRFKRKQIKALANFFEKYAINYSSTILRINIGSFKQEDFTKSISSIFDIHIENSIKNDKKNNEFYVSFDDFNTGSVVFYIEVLTTNDF